MIRLGEMQLSRIRELEASVGGAGDNLEEVFQDALSTLWSEYTKIVNEGKIPGNTEGAVAGKSKGLKRMIGVEEDGRYVIYLVDRDLSFLKEKPMPIFLEGSKSEITSPELEDEINLINIIKNNKIAFYKNYPGIAETSSFQQEKPKKLMSLLKIGTKSLPLSSETEDTAGDWFPASTIKFVAAYYFIKSIYDIVPDLNIENLSFRFTFPNQNTKVYTFENLLTDALIKSTNIEYNLLVSGIKQEYYTELINKNINMNRAYVKQEWKSLTGNLNNEFKINKLEYSNGGNLYSSIYESSNSFANQNRNARRATTANMDSLIEVIQTLVTEIHSEKMQNAVDLMKSKLSAYPKGQRGDQFISSLKETFKESGWQFFYKAGYAGDKGDVWYSMCIFGINSNKSFGLVGAVSFGNESPGENNINLANTKLPRPNVLDYERIGLNTLGKSIGTILSKEFGEQE